MPDKPTPLYYMISYAFPTADRCMYYRHKGKQCKVNNCSIHCVYPATPVPGNTEICVKGVDKTYQWGGAKVYHQRGHWPA